jgi:ribosomal protein S18 acetylase RimI-like enzyme
MVLERNLRAKALAWWAHSLNSAMPIIQTRLASLDDVPNIAPLFDAYRQFYEQPPDAALALQFIRERLSKQESVILLAEGAANQVLGFCQMYPGFCSVEAKPIYVLYDLFVQPPFRRTGAGAELLKAAELLSRQQGKARMDLTTAKTNKSAQSVYESLGWVRDEVFYAYSRVIAPHN